MVSFRPLPLYPRGKSPWYTSDRKLGGPQAGPNEVEKLKFLTLPGLQLRSLCCSSRSQSLYRLCYRRSCCCRVKVKSNLYYNRRPVDQSASLSWCQAPIWDPRPICLLLSLIIFRQLRACWCGHPLWREVESVVFSFCWASPAKPLFRSESHGTQEHVLLFLLLVFSQPGGPGSCIYFTPRNRVVQLYPQALGFVS
jgi:hypothetical protein